MPILFVDLETTGLAHQKDKILEVAAILTDDKLVELDRFHAVSNEASKIALGTLDPVVQQMHLENGLWVESAVWSKDVALERLRSIDNIDDRFSDWLKGHMLSDIAKDRRHAVSADELKKRAVQLGGSTIDFDRAFLQAQMPRTFALLHYRSVDATTLNEVARRMWPQLHAGRPGQGVTKHHRAMKDIEQSIAVVRYYVNAFASWQVSATDLSVATSDSASVTPPPALADDVLTGLRAIADLPPTALSKPLRTPEVAAAIAWIRAELVPAALADASETVQT